MDDFWRFLEFYLQPQTADDLSILGNLKMPVVGEVVAILTWGCWENIEHLGKNMEKSTFFRAFAWISMYFNVFHKPEIYAFP